MGQLLGLSLSADHHEIDERDDTAMWSRPVMLRLVVGCQLGGGKGEADASGIGWFVGTHVVCRRIQYCLPNEVE